MGLLGELAVSVGKTDGYAGFLGNRKRKVFAFGLFVMLLYFLITIIVPVVRFQMTTGGFGRILDRYIPDFRLAGGTLWVEDVIALEDDGMLIHIDTSPDYYFDSAEEMAGLLGSYDRVILADSEKCIIKNQGQISELYFDEEDFSFSKEQLLGYVPTVNLVVGGILILVYIWITAWFFFGVLIVTLFGMIVASCMEMDLSFGQVYLLAVYSRTLSLLIKALLSFLPFGVPFFWVANFGISLFYLSAAFRGIKKARAQAQGVIVIETKKDGSEGRM